MYLITKWFGSFLFNEKGIQKKILFSKKPKEIAKKLYEIDKNNILEEEKKLAKNSKIIVNEKRLAKIGDYQPENLFFKNVEIKPKDFGFSTDLLQQASVLASKSKVEEKLGSSDLQVIQMVNALDDLKQTSNLLSERLECWSDVSTSKEKIRPFEETYSAVNSEIDRLEKQIEKDMQNIAPNICKLAGPLVGARLISLAGGIKRLASIPASTIQILGAEKAFFRFKKEGGKPPKHGVIFQHPYVNKAPRSKRGKIARVLATKIAVATKADVFTKRDVSNILKDELDKRVKEIRNL